MKLRLSIGEQECICPECHKAYMACVDMDGYYECRKYCTWCDGTARDPIPWSELYAYRGEDAG